MEASNLYESNDGDMLTICTICYEEMGTEENPIMSIASEEADGFCTHNFCSECVNRWKAGGKTSHCPECRRKILGFVKNINANALVRKLRDMKRQCKELVAQAQERHANGNGENGNNNGNGLGGYNAVRPAGDELTAEERAKLNELIQENEQLRVGARVTLEEQVRILTERHQRELQQKTDENIEVLQQIEALTQRNEELERTAARSTEELNERLARQIELLRREREEKEELERRIQAATEMKTRDEANERVLRDQLQGLAQREQEGTQALQQLQQELSRKEAEQEKLLLDYEAEKRVLAEKSDHLQERTQQLLDRLRENELQQNAKRERQMRASVIEPQNNPQINANDLVASSGSEKENSEKSEMSWTQQFLFGYITPLAKRGIKYSSTWLGYDSYGFKGEHTINSKIQYLEKRGRRKQSNVFHCRADEKLGGYTDLALKRVSLPKYAEATANDAAAHKSTDFPVEVMINKPFYEAFREAYILSQMAKHPFVIPFLGVTRETNSLNIVMPMIGCDLEFYAYGQYDEKACKYFCLEQVRYMAHCLLSAVAYLHSANVVHRDIRLSSILLRLTEEPDISRRNILQFKLTNFQSARSVTGIFLDEPSMIGNLLAPNFRPPLTQSPSSIYTKAPEVGLWEHFQYVLPFFDWKFADVWAIGHALSTLVRGAVPLFTRKVAKSYHGSQHDLQTCVCDHVSQHVAIRELVLPSNVPTLSVLENDEPRAQNNNGKHDEIASLHDLLHDQLFPVRQLPSQQTSLSKLLASAPALPSVKGSILTRKENNDNSEDNIPTKKSAKNNSNDATEEAASLDESSEAASFASLIAQMMAFRPQQRKTCVELLSHPFFLKPSKQDMLGLQLSATSEAQDKHLPQFVAKCGGHAMI